MAYKPKRKENPKGRRGVQVALSLGGGVAATPTETDAEKEARLKREKEAREAAAKKAADRRGLRTWKDRLKGTGLE